MKTLTSREKKAIELVLTGKVGLLHRSESGVSSAVQGEGGLYIVILAEPPIESICSCEDSVNRKNRCKHQIAVEIRMEEERREKEGLI